MSHKILLQDWLFKKTSLTATPVTNFNEFIPISIPHSFNAQADTEASVFLMDPHLWNGVKDPLLALRK